ncbi:hypothetical protein [Lysinibacillus parviboronicapiens]|uniref:hypothetical protein n=1 Tax=Lysinibacillus parviboronicapiens TaxID=436516 RepID=UPI0006D1D3AB|nr:hypothetical protein [Lysinibacillus parviboronicapiens]
MKKNKKRIIIILATVFFPVFILYNLFWYGWMKNKYTAYKEGLNEFVPNRSYVLSESSYLYNVKFPNYLSFVGNLGVATDDNKIALIIWPSFFGENTYGVQIKDENDQVYSIMIKRDLSVVDNENADLIKNNKEQIEILFKKAQEKWGDSVL